MTLHAPDALVDPLTGIVTSVHDFPVPHGAPPAFHSVVAAVGDTRRYAVWLADRIGGGTSWGDADQARVAAVGEAVERYCGNHIPTTLPLCSAETARASGRDVLGPEELARFSEQQYARPGFAYAPWDASTEIRWVEGHLDADPAGPLGVGPACSAPGAFVYLNWHSGPRRHDHRITHLQYSGIATGTSVDDAARRALAEVVERDATVAWWMLGLPGRPVDITSVPGLDDFWAGSDLDLRLVLLPSEFGLPVVGALVRDPRFGIVATGFSAHESTAVAALKAAGEAVQVWTSAHGLLEADGPSYRAIASGIFKPHCYLEHRHDRRYLDDAGGPQLTAIRDLAAQVQLWFDPRVHHLLDRYDGQGPPVDATQVAPGDLTCVRRRLQAAGHRVVTVDLTTTDVAEVGWSVVRVLVAGLLPNAPAAYHYLGTPRLETLRHRHGVPADLLTLVPPPHN